MSAIGLTSRAAPALAQRLMSRASSAASATPATEIEQEILTELARDGPDAQRRFLEVVLANPAVASNEMGALFVRPGRAPGTFTVLVQSVNRLPFAIECTERHIFECWQAIRILATDQ